MKFSDRQEAGVKLAAALAKFKGEDLVVLSLPRGGVVLGVEVARALGQPHDLAIVRKIGAPENPEYAICVTDESGAGVICNEAEKAQLDPAWLEDAIAKEQAEAKRRREKYLTGRKPLDLTGKIVILVDDGIATGLTMRGAIRLVKTKKPAKIVVAIPVTPRDTAKILRKEADELVALHEPTEYLGSVGAYFINFPQTEDEEVIELMKEV